MCEFECMRFVYIEEQASKSLCKNGYTNGHITVQCLFYLEWEGEVTAMCMSHYFIGFGSAHLQSALAPSDNECSHRPMCLVRMQHPTVRFSFTLELLLVREKFEFWYCIILCCYLIINI